jgi:hypothetical protein
MQCHCPCACGAIAPAQYLNQKRNLLKWPQGQLAYHCPKSISLPPLDTLQQRNRAWFALRVPGMSCLIQQFSMTSFFNGLIVFINMPMHLRTYGWGKVCCSSARCMIFFMNLRRTLLNSGCRCGLQSYSHEQLPHARAKECCIVLATADGCTHTCRVVGSHALLRAASASALVRRHPR